MATGKKEFLNTVDNVATSARDNGKGAPITDTFNAGSAANAVTLLNAVTATGAGSPQNVANYKTLRIEVWGTGTFSVKIEAIGGSNVARALPIWDIANNKFVDANTITAAGWYDIDVQGFTKVQANATAIETGKNVNAVGSVLA